MTGDIPHQILVVVRASPVRERTAGLLESITSQKAPGLAKVVVLSQRAAFPGHEFRYDQIEQITAESDWMTQVRGLAMASGCRWLVLPSTVDRYLPGAFDAVVGLGAGEGQTVVGACQILQDGRPLRVGPDPFRFDYFALLSGFNYVAPGATFIDIRRCLASGGFNPRFPTTFTYEYLLRTGAAHGVECCAGALLETEADPFPGVPSEWASLYASEALAVTLGYNPSFVTPGAILGLLAVLADHVEPYAPSGFYHDQVVGRLSASGPLLKSLYLERLTGRASIAAQPPMVPRGLRARIKAVTPTPVWNTLRRAKRAWTAFRNPLP